MSRHHREPHPDQARLINDLHALGLRPGATVMVHAAFRSLGVRDPELVIRALRHPRHRALFRDRTRTLRDQLQRHAVHIGPGRCRHSLRVINGQTTTEDIQVWSTIMVSNPATYFNSSTFQPESAERVRLRPGQSREIRFSVMVPANVPAATVICVSYYLADDTRGFYFQPLNTRSGFCFVKEHDGSFRMVDAEEGRLLAEGVRGPAQGGGRPR